jgi:tRNA wybutosine-synthesizing protein 3
MDFDEQKKKYIDELKSGDNDRSKKGSVDKIILPLLNEINSKGNYYTTSSCAGRIVVLEKGNDFKKHETNWLLCSHSPLTIQKLKKSLEIIPKNPVWFKQESFIVHICSKGLDDARAILFVTKPIGLKRAGIVALGKRIIIEIIGNEGIDALIAKDGKMIVDENYLREIIKEANRRMNINRGRMDKLKEKVREIN